MIIPIVIRIKADKGVTEIVAIISPPWENNFEETHPTGKTKFHDKEGQQL